MTFFKTLHFIYFGRNLCDDIKNKFCIRVQNTYLNENRPSFPSPVSLLSIIDPIEAKNKPENYYLQAACEVLTHVTVCEERNDSYHEWKRWTDSQLAAIYELHHGVFFCMFLSL